MVERTEKYKNGIKVSIVVPVYNVSAYIERCINSVLNQRYHNIECIIVDDCTPDDSIEKAKKLVSTYKGDICFIFVAHEKNRGLSASRNTGTAHSTGDYIYYLDSDDEITTDCIALLEEVVSKHPDVEMVQGGVKSIPTHGQYDFSLLRNVEYVEDNVWVRRHYYTYQNMIPINAWGKLVKKSFIESHSLYFKEGLVHEDEQWMFFVVKVLAKIGFIHKPTYIHYCGTEGSIMSSLSIEKQAYHLSVILDDVVNNLDEPEKDAQLLYYLSRLALYYGHKEKIPYKQLMKKYKNVVLKEGYYDIYLMLLILHFTYPLIKGKGIKWIIYNRCVSKLNRMQASYFNE